ncbi:reverse transcriptase domain-containing protein [Tanacetum coccineum]
MPFGLKNAGTTYQRLVGLTFQSQIGKNLEAYVDDMLNPKKCSFGVEEGKFLGYMVTSEGIRANPRKMKALANLQSPRTLKEMQSLSGKLASLNHFLAKSAERLITDLSSLTPPQEKETLYAYLAVSAEAVSAVLLTDKKGRQCPVQYVSRTLSEAKRNYAPMEKLTLSLIHMTKKKLMMYFGCPIREVPWQIFSHEAPKGSGRLYLVRFWRYLLEKNDTESSPSWVKDSSTNEHIEQCEVKMDSKLVASQINRSYEANKDSMIKYLAKAKEYASGFKSFSIENIHRNMNQKADVLSKLASAIRQGYYWPTMHEDAKEEVQKCDSCQIHAPVPRLPKTLMTSIMAPWPFYQWGMDILGPLPPARGGAKFIIVAIDYFTKWIKAKPLVKITGKEVIRFVMDNIICRFGLPKIIITDNGAQLVNDSFKSWCGRSLMEGIKTRLGREKVRWVDELPNVLWAHRTSIKQSNRETPFSLTYGSEAVIPAEIVIPTYRTLMIREGYNEEEMRLNLDLLQEKREADAVREAKYKTKMEQYYNKKVCPTGFRPGKFVFRRNEASRVEDQGKLGPKWEGPYRVVEAYENGSYKLQTLEDKEVPSFGML